MDHRRYPRQDCDVMVELTHPAMGVMTVRAINLSDGGMAVSMGNHVPPPAGTVLQVRIKRHTGTLNSQPVAMKVVHVQADGSVGLVFA